MSESTEVMRASRALLFFCKNMDPAEQWEMAVNLMREMNHMEKAAVWRSMVEQDINSAQLSVRRTAYKRALREVEKGVCCHVSGNSVDLLNTQAENGLLADYLDGWIQRYASGGGFSGGDSDGLVHTAMGVQFEGLKSSLGAEMQAVKALCASKAELEVALGGIDAKLEGYRVQFDQLAAGLLLMAKKDELERCTEDLKTEMQRVETESKEHEARNLKETGEGLELHLKLYKTQELQLNELRAILNADKADTNSKIADILKSIEHTTVMDTPVILGEGQPTSTRDDPSEITAAPTAHPTPGGNSTASRFLNIKPPDPAIAAAAEGQRQHARAALEARRRAAMALAFQKGKMTTEAAATKSHMEEELPEFEYRLQQQFPSSEPDFQQNDHDSPTTNGQPDSHPTGFPRPTTMLEYLSRQFGT